MDHDVKNEHPPAVRIDLPPVVLAINSEPNRIVPGTVSIGLMAVGMVARPSGPSK